MPVRNYKILIAEDDSLNRMMLSKLMQKFEIDCVMAEDGRDALEKFEPEKFSAVFLDINMPEYNGDECAQLIIEKCVSENKVLPYIISITADEEYRNNKLFCGYLSKPFDVVSIKSMIDEINTCISSGSVYSVEDAAQKIGFDTETMLMLTGEFLNVMAEEITNLNNAVSEDNREMITHVAHKMKGASANMMAETLRQLCSDMQNVDKSDSLKVSILKSKINCAFLAFKSLFIP